MPTVQKFIDLDPDLIKEAQKRMIAEGTCESDVSIREVITKSVENWLSTVVSLADISGYGSKGPSETNRRPRSFDEETWKRAEYASKNLVDMAAVALLRGALRLQGEYGDNLGAFRKSLAKRLLELEGEVSDKIVKHAQLPEAPAKKRSSAKKQK
jgi:hypothetical protein